MNRITFLSLVSAIGGIFIIIGSFWGGIAVGRYMDQRHQQMIPMYRVSSSPFIGHMVQGQVESVNGNQLLIKDEDNDTVRVLIQSMTEVTRDDQRVGIETLNSGEQITVVGLPMRTQEGVLAIRIQINN